MRRRRLLALAVLPLLGGCAGQAFRQEPGVMLSSPLDRQHLTLPVRLAWSAPSALRAASFAVLVDRSPQPPGRTISFFVEDDEVCKGQRLQACLTPAYLTTRGIFVTGARELVLEALAERDTVWASSRGQHDVVVVPLDAQGRRIGESWSSVRVLVPPTGSVTSS